LIFQLFPRLINALQRNVVSKIIVVTLLVAIMKDQASELERWLSEWTKKKTRKEQEKWIG